MGLTIAFWRPTFYTRYYSNLSFLPGKRGLISRTEPEGIAGTGPGVDAYYAHVTCKDGTAKTLGPLTGPANQDGEVPRQTVNNVYVALAKPCVVTVRTSNKHWETGFPGEMLDRAEQNIALRDPAVTLTWVAELSARTNMARTGESLRGDALDLYTFTAYAGHTYSFCVYASTASACNDDKTTQLLLFGPSGKVREPAATDKPNQLSWTEPGSGPRRTTYTLVVRRRARVEGTVTPYSYTLQYTIPRIRRCTLSEAISGTPRSVCDPTDPIFVVSTLAHNAVTVSVTNLGGATSGEAKRTMGANCDAEGTLTTFKLLSANTAGGVSGASSTPVSYPFDNLTASTPYTLCVRSVRTIEPGFVLKSDWTSVSATTAALPQPTNLTVRDVTDSKATLRWNKATDADGYEVQIDGADVETTLGKNATSYEFTLPSADTAYKLGVAAKHGDRLSAFATLTLLKPPSSITQGTTAHNSVKYTWTDGNPTGSATGAEVKIGATGTKKTADSTTYHTFNNLSANEEYTFYIRLKNSQGPSAWRTTTITTPAQPRLPKPSGLSVTNVGQNSLTLNWSAVADAGGYKVKRTGSSSTWTLPSASRSHRFTGLTSNFRYTLYVQALPKTGSSKVASAWAPKSHRTNSALPPPTPQPPTLSLTTCLSSARLEAYANWFTDDSHCRSVRASALWSALRNAGIEVGCISRLILGSGEDPMWERYQAAGSRTNFLLRSYDILWLSRSACPTGSGVSGSSDAGALELRRGGEA